jgi:hypothetical protein
MKRRPIWASLLFYFIIPTTDGINQYEYIYSAKCVKADLSKYRTETGPIVFVVNTKYKSAITFFLDRSLIACLTTNYKNAINHFG